MSYQQALSGLGAASSELDVIGNISRTRTVGFKSGQAQFADMYANSMATAVNNQIGIGTRLAEVQQFSQGMIMTTNQALEVAINGSGFYQLSNNGSTVYSRNGVFYLDNTGKIVKSAGPTDGLCGQRERRRQQREHRAADRADFEHPADGDATDELTGFTVGSDGTTGNYSNGNTRSLGQIVLANFNNQNGLQDLDGNVYAQTAASGAP